jgi:hypothetical protein
MAQVYYSLFESTLYVSDKNIVTANDKKHAKVEFSYDAGNNNAFIKYNDTNYFPHSIVFTSRGTLTEYRCIIECRIDRKVSDKDVFYIVFNIKVNPNISNTSLSKLMLGMKSSGAQQEVVLLKSEDFMNDDKITKGTMNVSNGIVTCVLADAVEVKSDLGFTSSPDLVSLFPNIVLSSANDMPVTFKKTSLYSVMDCVPMEGDDLKQMKNTNMSELVSPEDMLNKTVILFVIFAGIIGLISVFFDPLYEIFIIKFMIGANMDENGKLHIGIVNMYWMIIVILFSLAMFLVSLKHKNNDYMMGGIIVGGIFLLFNLLFGFSKKYNPRTAIGDSGNRQYADGTGKYYELVTQFRWSNKLFDPNYLTLISVISACVMYIVAMVMGFQGKAKSAKLFDMFISLYILLGAGGFFFRTENMSMMYILGPIMIAVIVLLALRIEKKI